MPQVLFPTFRYSDAHAAIRFLQDAFGFEARNVTASADGGVAHAELELDGGVVMLGSQPDGSDGRLAVETGPSWTYAVVADVDAHAQRARAAGAEIVLEPTDQPYGARDYTARDPEGHLWSFGTYRP